MSNFSRINLSYIATILESEGQLLGKVNFRKCQIADIATDSRQVTENTLFVCIRGFVSDGHEYAQSAVEKGAIALIVEEELDISAPQLIVRNSRRSTAIAASIIFESGKRAPELIGVTGTNGKTTVSHIIHHILTENGYKTGLIGTLGYYIGREKFPLERTTPDIVELHKILYSMKDCDYIVMEVSSHSIALDRVYRQQFAAVLFTNLSRDHLDFHKTMDAYKETKFRFVSSQYKEGAKAIINIDDNYGKKLAGVLGDSVENVSIESVRNLKSSVHGYSFNLENDVNEYRLPMSGKHNLSNALMAIKCCTELCQVNEKNIAASLSSLPQVDGRMMKIDNKANLNIYIDYAHTPDALEKVIKSVESVPHKRIICLFGAGGNRDKSKRSEMGFVVSSFADLSIITTDNPRDEEPPEIIRDIMKGVSSESDILIRTDRKKALESVIGIAGKDDIIIIAGKGHETYQEVKGEKQYFNDREIILNIIDQHYSVPENARISGTIELEFPVDSLQLEYLFATGNLDSREYKFVSTDSRTIRDYSVFFALEGESFDGHSFIESVLQNSTCIAVGHKDFDNPKYIKVDDSLKAYQKFASFHRSIYSSTNIAITGSTGKTTTKEYLAAILGKEHNVLTTYKNENNQIGTAKTLLQLNSSHEYSVLELGSNHFGEIAAITEICKPDIAIITSIGNSHLEFFETIEGVLKEKSDIFMFDKTTKIAPVEFFGNSQLENLHLFGENSDYSIIIEKADKEKVKFRINDIKLKVSSPVIHNAWNAGIASIAALQLGIDAEIIRNGIELQPELGNRMNIFEKAGNTWIADCYNANPDSMKAAIDFWKKYKADRPHVAVLGDMLELGESADNHHKAIGDLLKSANVNQTASVGSKAEFYCSDTHFTNVNELLSSDFLKKIKPDSVVLVKASHGIQLDKIIDKIRKES